VTASSVHNVRLRGMGPVLALSGTTALWGSTFFMSKDLVARHDPLTVLAVRFGIATGLMVLVRPRSLRGLSRRTWLRAVALGAVYGLAQIPQYYGLRLTSASASGFLIGTYVAFTPLFGYLVFRARSSPRTYLGVALAVGALMVISFQDWHLGPGEGLSLVAAALYGLQIVTMGAWSVPGRAWAMTAIQMGTITVVVGTPALFGGVDVPTSGTDWAVVLYLAAAAGALAIGVQTWAQSRLAATQAAVIIAAEPLWAAGFAVVFTSEVLTGSLVVGGVMLLSANVLISWTHGRPTPQRRALDRDVSRLPA
jgi:drug/metabolite transporter (DMT)-like permease